MTFSQYLKDHADELDKNTATVGRVESVLALLHDYMSETENQHAHLVHSAQIDLLETYDRMRRMNKKLRGILYSNSNEDLADLDLPGNLEGREEARS